MLLLTTVWAFTICKSQGQTFTGKVVLNVSDHEREHGLTYVAFSLATRFSNIGLQDGITDTCLRDKIWKQGKIRRRIQHERNLDRLNHETKIWMVTCYE
jgi:hypothetical protein